jgi:hypothetical protein
MTTARVHKSFETSTFTTSDLLDFREAYSLSNIRITGEILTYISWYTSKQPMEETKIFQN